MSCPTARHYSHCISRLNCEMSNGRERPSNNNNNNNGYAYVLFLLRAHSPVYGKKRCEPKTRKNKQIKSTVHDAEQYMK